MTNIFSCDQCESENKDFKTHQKGLREEKKVHDSIKRIASENKILRVTEQNCITGINLTSQKFLFDIQNACTILDTEEYISFYGQKIHIKLHRLFDERKKLGKLPIYLIIYFLNKDIRDSICWNKILVYQYRI